MTDEKLAGFREKIPDHSRVPFPDFHCPASSAFMRHRRDGNGERNRNFGGDSILGRNHIRLRQLFLMYRKYKEALEKRLPQSRIPSYLGVWGNPVAIVIDILFLLGLIGTVYCNVTIGANRILNFLSLFITITCFYLHFLATGKVFQYLAQAKMKKGVKENERKADM